MKSVERRDSNPFMRRRWAAVGPTQKDLLEDIV